MRQNSNTIMLKIAEIIKRKRKEKELTQAKLAQELDIGIRTYVDYESGNSSIKFSTLLKIMEILNIDPFQIAAIITEEFKTRSQESFLCLRIYNFIQQDDFFKKIQESVVLGYENKEKEKLEEAIESLKILTKVVELEKKVQEEIEKIKKNGSPSPSSLENLLKDINAIKKQYTVKKD